MINLYQYIIICKTITQVEYAHLKHNNNGKLRIIILLLYIFTFVYQNNFRRENGIFNTNDVEYDSDDEVPDDRIRQCSADHGEFIESYESEIMRDVINVNENSTTEQFDPFICPTSTPIPSNFANILQCMESSNMFDHLISTSMELYNKSIHNTEPAISSNVHYLTKPKITVDKPLLSWLDNKDNNSLLIPTSSIEWNGIPRDTRIQLIDDALSLANRKYYKSSIINSQIDSVSSQHTRPSITEVSQHFTLTAKQHACFAVISLSLLKGWQNKELNLEKFEREFIDFTKSNQNLIFLTGEGGTGKSRIIDAIEYFCNKWGRPDSLAKTALTGKASYGIKGDYDNK
jgi:hypothetical protein